MILPDRMDSDLHAFMNSTTRFLVSLGEKLCKSSVPLIGILTISLFTKMGFQKGRDAWAIQE